MAVTFGSIATSAPSTAARAVTVTCPSGTITGDLLIFFAGNTVASAYGTNPTGWTKITAPASASTDLASCCWYKIATSSDVASSTTYTATPTSTSTSGTAGVIVRYTGYDSTKFPLASTEFIVTHGTTASTTSTTPTNPSAGVQATDLALRVFMAGEGTAATGMTMTAPAGWNNRGSAIANTSTFNTGILVLDKTGSTDTLTASSNKSSMWDIYTISIPVGTQSLSATVTDSATVSESVTQPHSGSRPITDSAPAIESIGQSGAGFAPKTGAFFAFFM